MQVKQYILLGIILIMIGAGGFYAGMKYQQNKRGQFMRQFGGETNLRGGNGQFRTNGNRSGFRPVAGDIINQDASSITVKLPDNSSRIVWFNENTIINQTASASAHDLKIGDKVAVFGQENTDGSVTAQNIQLNPQIRMDGEQSSALPQTQ